MLCIRLSKKSAMVSVMTINFCHNLFIVLDHIDHLNTCGFKKSSALVILLRGMGEISNLYCKWLTLAFYHVSLEKFSQFFFKKYTPCKHQMQDKSSCCRCELFEILLHCNLNLLQLIANASLKHTYNSVQYSNLLLSQKVLFN